MRTLIVPGLHGSGEDHWQRWWLSKDRSADLVEQDDWMRPRLDDWRARLGEAVAREPGALLVAHSLGCALVANLATRHPDVDIAGALLVAPADVDDMTWTDPALAAFGPMPMRSLPFPSIVVASHSDPFVSFHRAHAFATAWGAHFFDLGHAGHINVASGFGPWPLGLCLADELRALIGVSGDLAAGADLAGGLARHGARRAPLHSLRIAGH